MTSVITHLPHWIVGEERIFNQLSAWQKIISSKQAFRFYFYENEYDQHDWTLEPRESWDDLVKVRCVQLRQRYKNLKLFYSAGRDSDHILQSFIKHNIPIDELVLLHWPDNSIRNFEHINYILPRAQQYLKVNPLAKITVVIIGKAEYEKYYREAWVENKGASMCLGYFLPTQFGWITNHLEKIKDSSTGYIVGADKPKLIFKGDNVYTAILDKTLEVYLESHNSIECFYYAPDLPELYIKQCHILVKYLEENYSNADQSFISEFLDNSKSPYYNEMCVAVGRGNGWNNNLSIQNGKNKYDGGHTVFQQLKEQAKQENWQSINYYSEMIEYYRKIIPNAFHSDNIVKGGTIGIWGKQYFIKKFNRNTSVNDVIKL